MHIGLIMECDYRSGLTQQGAFNEAYTLAQVAEDTGFDEVWLAERHFASPEGSAGVPSIVSAPLILATSILERTSRLRVGTGVLVLPLGHPIRMAEEVATLDNIAQGRFDLGVGRSGFTRSYEGYDLPYEESRDRFEEYLNIMRLAWTQDRFSYEGAFFTFDDVCVIPKPFQTPHPPLWAAATTRPTFEVFGRLGLDILVGLRGMTASDLSEALVDYHEAWRRAGHSGDGKVILRVPIYVSDTMEKAISEPRDSALHAYARLQAAFTGSIGKAGTELNEERAERSERLASTTFDDLLDQRLAYGTHDVVTERLNHWKDELGLAGFIMESNVGGRIPFELVLESIRRYADEVVPALR